MPDYSPRGDSVNVEQIMEQIRSRIREKRGVDYEAQQLEELAKARLEQMLDPRSAQSEVLDRLKQLQPAFEAPKLPSYEFEDSTLYESTRGPLRFIRKLLNPILKLFFNPNPLIGALNTQARLNKMAAEHEAKRDAMRLAGDQLHYQLLHNLLLELTRASLELKSLRMTVESISGRLEFNERRARAIESAVAFPQPLNDHSRERPARNEAPPAPIQPQASASAPAPPSPAQSSSTPSPGSGPQYGSQQTGEGAGSRSRRRRRRRGRRGGGPGGPQQGVPSSLATGAASSSGSEPESGHAVSATDDLENFGGAESHPSERDQAPSSGPADEPPEAGPDEPTQ